MHSAAQIARASTKLLWTGRVMSGLVIVFLLMDSVIKVMRVPAAVQGTGQLGYSQNIVAPLGVILLASTILYAVPRTAVLGAILVTAYLGGASAAQVRVGNPLFSNVLFPVYVGVLLWAGLFLREPRLRALIPFRS